MIINSVGSDAGGLVTLDEKVVFASVCNEIIVIVDRDPFAIALRFLIPSADISGYVALYAVTLFGFFRESVEWPVYSLGPALKARTKRVKTLDVCLYVFGDLKRFIDTANQMFTQSSSREIGIEN